MTPRIHPEAEAEFGDAAAYYASHASQSIAEAFVAEFERVRGLIAENPRRGQKEAHGLRVYHFQRFPYSMIYAEDSDRGLQIFAVSHQSREPEYWRKRT